MGYVVQATWTATEESADAVRAALAELGPLSRQEPGCRLWIAHQEPDRPLVFELFEVYDDEAAYEAHGASEHFRAWGTDRALPLLESRERSFLETIEPGTAGRPTGYPC